MARKTKVIGAGRAVLFALALGIPAQALAEEPPETVPGIEPGETLSEHLDEEKGVITPPPVGDAEIHVPAPDPDPGTTPVIPPPGTAGGEPGVVPK